MAFLRRTFLLASLAALALPAAAPAATVSLAGGEVLFSAGPGERNSPIFTSTETEIVVDDQSNRAISAGPGCVVQRPGGSPSSVHCPRTGVTRIVTLLGDGSDRVTFFLGNGTSLPVTVSGGAGIDSVTAEGTNSLDGVQNDGVGGLDNIGADVERLGNSVTATDDDFTGNDADNRLESIGGLDVMDGAGGDDYIYARDGSSAAPADRITCGPGVDVVDADSADAVADDCEIVIRESGVVLLTEAADSFRAPRPNLAIFGLGGDDTIAAGAARVVSGGDGDDRITLGAAGTVTATGDDGDDRIYGLVGRDRILGGDGNDRLYGERSSDRIDGGRGRDFIDAGRSDDVVRLRDGEVDRVRCSTGRDTVVADKKDRVERDCEKVYRR